MKTNYIVRFAVAIAVVFFGFEPSRSQATTITVTSSADSGAGTLRSALLAAGNGDNIVFSLTAPATITLTNGELFVSTNVAITGPGPTNLTISANTNSRVFNIASNRTVTLVGLTIRDGLSAAGFDGGGIFNAGILTLTNCLIASNLAGSATSFSGPGANGGGIYNSGTLTIVACTFRANDAGVGGTGISHDPFDPIATAGGRGGNGGAIFNAGSLNLNSCTFYDNRAGRGGTGGGDSLGGVAANGGLGGSGGGIFNMASMSSVASTFSGNSGGAGGNGGFAFSVFNGGYGGQGGIGGDAGAITNVGPAGSVTLRNTIIALNSAGPAGPGGFGISASGPSGAPGTLPDISGSFASQGRNLVGAINGSTGITNGSGGNIAGTTSIPLNPRLGALQDNGGPIPTMSLLASSPAIDTGDDTLSGTDQRGFPRLSGPHVDMGACEGVSQLYSRGEALLVGDGLKNSVVAIDVRSGDGVGTFVQPGAGNVYQTLGPRGLLCFNNWLLVVNQNVDTPYNGEILKFDLNTGVFLSKFVSSANANAPYAPRGLIAGPNNVVYVADVGGFDGVHPGRIARYNSAGTFLGNVATTGIPVPFYPMALVTGPDAFLYVSGVGDLSQGSINGFVFRFQFNAATQNYQFLNTVITSTGANYYSPGLHSPEGIAFGPDGNIYVTSFNASFYDSLGTNIVDRDAILTFNTSGQKGGSPIYLYATNEDRVYAQTLLFGPRGDLFVPVTSTAGVRRYSASSNFQQFTVLPTTGMSVNQPWYLTFRATDPKTLAYQPPSLRAIPNSDHIDVSWPSTFVGWQLQAQASTLSTGIGTNWMDIAQSLQTNSLSFSRDPSTDSAFFRLAAP